MHDGTRVIAAAALAALVGFVPAGAIAQTAQAPDAATSAAESATPEAPATAASPAAPGDAAESQPLTVKMATVPPPVEFRVPAGYRTVKRGLDTVYCTSITPIGSRMPQTYCLTQAQVIERERQEEAARREVAQKSNVAGTPSGP